MIRIAGDSFADRAELLLASLNVPELSDEQVTICFN
jgi:lipid II:glycine glycyltransferase (peptidoglycan interpeptide bridge formation enzyme)